MACASKLALAVALLLAFLISPRALPQETPPANQTVSIHGVVISSLTREPIGRALVSSSDNRFATMTDSQGRFEFVVPKTETGKNLGVATGVFSSNTVPMVTNGPIWLGVLAARKPGFLPDPSDPVTTLPVNSGEEITLSLIPEALITGRVILPSSDAATPIQLQLFKRQVQEGRAHWVPAGDASARSNGEFRFSELSAGVYKLFTTELLDQDPEITVRGGQVYGYPPIYFPTAHSFAAAATIHLSAGKTFHADLTPVRQPYYRVKVPVANAASGAPIGVTVMAQGNRGPGFSLGYNERNRAIEGMLPNGVYALEAASFGPFAGSAVATISIQDAPVDGPAMTLAPNGSIPVNLRYELTSHNSADIRTSGARYANVHLEPADDFGQERPVFPRPPTGPKDEGFVFEGVPPGRYWVRVDSGAVYPAALTSGGIDLVRHPLVIGAGSGGAPIEITLRDDGAELEGTVEGLDAASGKAPTADAGAGSLDAGPYQAFTFVYCVPLPDSTGQFAQAPVGRKGEFTFPRLAPGTYRVLVFTRQQSELEFQNPEAMRPYDSKALVVRLVAGQKEHVRVPVIRLDE